MSNRLLLALAAALIVAIAWLSWAYLRDMRQAYQRVQGRSTVVMLPYGAIEYVQGGSGPAVLVIHGGGGGFDQGELIAQLLLGEQLRWIAPSRFGYLGSALPHGATWDDQANAYAQLLDRLGIGQVAVVALSQGGPSALLFALLHPQRVSSLSCVSCGVVASKAAAQAQADRKGALLKALFSRDLPYWLASRFFERRFMGVMGASPEVVAALTPGQRESVSRLIAEMNPAAPRAAGAAFDNEATLPGDRIAAVEAPTLIVHARDDTLQLFHNAAFAAVTIPGARLMSFDHGGHLVLAVEQQAIGEAVRAHIVEHLGDASHRARRPTP